MAITYTEAPGDPSIAAHAQTEEPLCEVVTTVLALPIGRARRPQCLRFVLVGPIQGNRGGVLMQPGRRDSIDFERLERDGAKDLIEIGGKQGVQDVA